MTPVAVTAPFPRTVDALEEASSHLHKSLIRFCDNVSWFLGMKPTSSGEALEIESDLPLSPRAIAKSGCAGKRVSLETFTEEFVPKRCRVDCGYDEELLRHYHDGIRALRSVFGPLGMTDQMTVFIPAMPESWDGSDEQTLYSLGLRPRVEIPASAFPSLESMRAAVAPLVARERVVDGIDHSWEVRHAGASLAQAVIIELLPRDGLHVTVGALAPHCARPAVSDFSIQLSDPTGDDRDLSPYVRSYAERLR